MCEQIKKCNHISTFKTLVINRCNNPCWMNQHTANEHKDFKASLPWISTTTKSKFESTAVKCANASQVIPAKSVASADPAWSVPENFCIFSESRSSWTIHVSPFWGPSVTESKKLFAILRSMCDLNSECQRQEIIDRLTMNRYFILLRDRKKISECFANRVMPDQLFLKMAFIFFRGLFPCSWVT